MAMPEWESALTILSPNIENPKHLYTGITLVGKEACIPSGVSIGRNCIINSQTTAATYPGKEVEDGYTV